MIICLVANPQTSHCRKWADVFHKMGHEVHVISIYEDDIPGVCIHRLSMTSKNPSNLLQKFFSYIYCFFKAKKLIWKIKPDILHAHNITTNGFIASYSGYHPFILTPWGSDIVWDKFYYNIFNIFVRMALRKADAITTTSKMLVKRTSTFAPRRNIHLIHFGIDLEKLQPSFQLRDKDGPFHIGLIKTLEKKYGVEYLLRAAAIVAMEHPNIRLTIIGQGSQLKTLKKLAMDLGISSLTDFIGWIPHSDIGLHLHSLDTFVVPSVYESETFGVAAAEAQACGVPVIASNVGGLPECVRDGYSGFIVPPRDSKSIAKKITYLIENPAVHHRMQWQARDHVSRNFDFQKNAGDMISVYKDVIQTFSVKSNSNA